MRSKRTFVAARTLRMVLAGILAGAIAACAVAAGAAAAADLTDVTHSGSIYIAARDDGSVHRSNGGLIYTVRSTGAATPLRGVAFLTPLFVAVGDGGRIVRSSDGGLNWTPEVSNTTANLRDVIAHGTSLSAVGDDGTTLRRFGTATSWDTTASATPKTIRGVASNGLNILVAVGDDGLVLRSTDQGLSWSKQTLTGAPDLRGVSGGANSAHFVAVSFDGRIVRSTNFGVDWETVLQSTEEFHDVASDAANRFIAVGGGGTIFRSGIDAAPGSWLEITTTIANHLFGVYRDATHFYAVGSGDFVARSTDGTTWIPTAVEPQSWSSVKSRYR
jgi:hypothetical protein